MKCSGHDTHLREGGRGEQERKGGRGEQEIGRERRGGGRDEIHLK